jgi:tetratricopeptide (TPR) repeat protein
MKPRMAFQSLVGILLSLSVLFMSPADLTAQAAPASGPEPNSEHSKLRSQEADRWNEQGLRLFAEGRFTEAAHAFEKVYEIYPNLPDVGYNLGLALQRAGKDEESIAPLQKSLATRPGDPGAERALGVSLLNLNRGQEGLEHLLKSLQGDPRNVDTLYYLALAYYGRREFDRAEQCLQWMFERNSDSALLHLRTANAHRINKRYQDALAELKKAEALDPNVPTLYLEFGLTYIGLKNGPAAGDAIQEEIRRHPGSAEAYLTLGELFLLVEHDYPRAKENIQKAQQFGIAPARAEFDLGDLCFRMNQLEDAAEHLERAVRLNPKDRRAHYLLAKVYQRQGKMKFAEEHFAIAETLNKQERAELSKNFREMFETGEAGK